MTYKELSEINSRLDTVTIKGSEYVTVNSRVQAYRMLYPEGRIETTLLSDDGARCVMLARIYTEDGRLLASATAYEKESNGFVNKTSYIENCETSAVGRALGFLGIGISTSIASADEMQNAIKQQEHFESARNGEIVGKKIASKKNESKPKTQDVVPMIAGQEIGMINSLLLETQTDMSKILNYYNVNELDEMTEKQASNCIDLLTAKKKKEKAL